jgi:hypothetical protein
MATYSVYIPILKACFPFLNKYWGFEYADISFELSAIYKNHFENGAINEDIRNICLQNGQVDAIKYALESDGHVKIRCTEDFGEQIDKLVSFFSKQNVGESLQNLFFLISVVSNRRTNYLDPYENELGIDTGYEDYRQYVENIRPDMLKLYAVLKRNEGIKPHNITLGIGSAPLIKLKNDQKWIEKMLLEYLDKYLGVNSLEEANEELNSLYSDSKGRRIKKSYMNYFICGTYRFISENIKQSVENKVTAEQCKFLIEYLMCIDMITPKDKICDPNTMQGVIKSLLKSSSDPVQNYLKYKDYRISPNNDTMYFY